MGGKVGNFAPRGCPLAFGPHVLPLRDNRCLFRSGRIWRSVSDPLHLLIGLVDIISLPKGRRWRFAAKG